MAFTSPEKSPFSSLGRRPARTSFPGSRGGSRSRPSESCPKDQSMASASSGNECRLLAPRREVVGVAVVRRLPCFVPAWWRKLTMLVEDMEVWRRRSFLSLIL